MEVKGPILSKSSNVQLVFLLQCSKYMIWADEQHECLQASASGLNCAGWRRVECFATRLSFQGQSKQCALGPARSSEDRFEARGTFCGALHHLERERERERESQSRRVPITGPALPSSAGSSTGRQVQTRDFVPYSHSWSDYRPRTLEKMVWDLL